MKMSKYILVALILGVACSKLVYIAQVFRHGARYPVTDIYDGKQTKPFHGQLTSVGMRQQYLLGSFIRTDYIDQVHLLKPTLDTTQIEAFSDGSERCFDSAYAHLAGLYPLGQGQTIPAGLDPKYLQPPFESTTSLLQESPNADFALDLGYQPVPIKAGNTFFPQCPQQTNILIKRGQFLAKILAEFQVEQAAFTEKIRLIFNLTIELANIAGLADLYDVVVCDLYLGRKMPVEFTQDNLKELRFVQSYLFISIYSGQPARIFSAPLAYSIIENMEKITKSAYGNKKMTIFSGHDTNLAPMIAFFNLSSAECIKRRYKKETVTGNCAEVVPFASNMIFELHQSDSDSAEIERASSYYVKIRYNGDYYKLCERESTECPFDEFAARVRREAADFKKECGIK